MNASSASQSEASTAASNALVAPISLAVIGCTLAHIRYSAALKSLPYFNVVALVDSDIRLARGWGRELGKPAIYTDVESLLASDTQFQAALVSAPPSKRAAAFRLLLDAGKSLVGDLPFAPLLSQSTSLMEGASKTGAFLVPWLPRRFDPNFLTVRELLAASDIGSVNQLRCVWSFPAGGWFAAEQGGDPENRSWSALLPQIACQTVDVAVSFLGEAYSVSADIDASAEILAAPGRRHGEMIATVIVNHDGGQSTHHFTRSRSVQPSERYLFTGSVGSLELSVPPGEGTVSAPTVVTLSRPGQRPEVIPIEATILTRTERLLGYFADRIRGNQTLLLNTTNSLNTPNPVDTPGRFKTLDAQDGRTAQEIVSAAYLSARDNVKISLPLRRDADVASS